MVPDSTEQVLKYLPITLIAWPSARRVEQAKHLLRAGPAQAGFYDQSQFSHYFKRLVGVTPSQFRTPSRIA
jgi:AraC-like DNA-binding protein